MTDLHTHILPRMDDGAPDTAASLAMLRMEAAQGVTGVALTPPFSSGQGEHRAVSRASSSRLGASFRSDEENRRTFS